MSKGVDIFLSILAICISVVLLLCGSCFGVFGVFFIGTEGGNDRVMAVGWLIIAALLIWGGVATFRLGIRQARKSPENPPNA